MKILIQFFATETPDGTIHIQNAIDGLPGQHHVHTKESFERWRSTLKPKYLEIKKGECSCGLRPGQVREYDGDVWFNDRFLADGGRS